MNYYETLGVNHTTPPEEIKKAYRRLASKHHPDKGGDEAQFRKIQEAWEVLGDPAKKYQYDNPQPDWQRHSPNEFSDFADIFNGVFGQGRQATRNPDAQVNAQITLKQAYLGSTFVMDLHSGESVNVRIPAGVRDGTRFRLQGKARQRDPNLPPGDLYVMVHIEPLQDWGRQEDNLYVRKEIDAIDAMVGTKVDIKHINDKTYSVQIPKGIQPGEKVRLNGLGMDNPRSGVAGALYVIVDVRIPNIKDQAILDVLNTMRQRGYNGQ